MIAELEKIKEQFISEVDGKKFTRAALEQLHTKYVGRKGLITEATVRLKDVPKDQKPQVGKVLNDIKRYVEDRLAGIKADVLGAETNSEEAPDSTLPGRRNFVGHIHPLTQVLDEIKSVFYGMGFTVEDCYAGRGIKGQKSRSGSHKMRAGFEGGQMPLYMRLGKQPGATSKDAMPIGPFRTHTQGVNVRDLERVFAVGSEVTPEALKSNRLIRSLRIDVKILGEGELTKKLAVSAHGFSKTAREKIEAAGGTAVLLREPKVKKRKRLRKAGARPADTDIDDVETPAAEAEEPAAPADDADDAVEPDAESE